MHAGSPSASPRLVAPALLLLLAGCSSASAPEVLDRAEVTEEETAESAVVAVDRDARSVTIEREDGRRMTLICGPDVRNFDRINQGDKVKAFWRMSLSVRKLAENEPDTPAVAKAAGTRAEEGAEPAAAVAAGVAMTARLESVDPANHVVVFTDNFGFRRTVKARRDEGKRFVEGLKPGDRVEIIHKEGVALAVE